ncbi:MAG: hypothetical protein JWP97_5027 [Labilithrix sp.]|nr:hypothetical protein [Labilithrix sp.]
MLSKIRPSFLVLSLLAAAAVTGAVIVACDDTSPSPIGEHFDDASVIPDAAKPAEDASDEAGDDGGEEAGEDAGVDAADAGDAGDADADAG